MSDPGAMLRELAAKAQRQPDDALTWYRWAVALARAGQRAAALQTARHAAGHARPAPLLVNLGKLFEVLDEPAEAVPLYRRACAADASFLDAPLRLASLLRRAGDVRAAVLTLRAALARAPGAAVLALELADALAEARQPEEAIAFAHQALQGGAPAEAAHRALARAHGRLGNVGPCLASLGELGALEDEDAVTLVAVARTLASHGATGEAVAALERGRRAAPGGRAQLVIGEALEELGAHLTALESLRDAVRLAPDSGPAHAALGHALAKHGERAEAIAALRVAVRALPEDAAALAALAALLGPSSEATSLWVKAAALAPEDEHIRDALAQALAATPRRGAPRATAASASITSDLAMFSVPELLEFLFQQRASGTLFLRGPGGAEGTIELSDGQLAGARSPAGKRLSEVLIEDDLVSRTDLMRTTPSPEQEQDATLAAALLARHLVDREALLARLTRRVRDELTVVVTWREGTATFLKSGPVASPPAIVVDTRWAVMEALRRVDELARAAPSHAGSAAPTHAAPPAASTHATAAPPQATPPPSPAAAPPMTPVPLRAAKPPPLPAAGPASDTTVDPANHEISEGH